MKGMLFLVALLAVCAPSFATDSSLTVTSDTLVGATSGQCSACTWSIISDIDDPEDPEFTEVFEWCNEEPGEFPYPIPAGTLTRHWVVSWNVQSEVEHSCETLDIEWDDLLDPPDTREIVASWPAHWEMVPAWSCYTQSVKWLRKFRMQQWKATTSGVTIDWYISRSGEHIYDWDMFEETKPMVMGGGGAG